MSVCGYVCGYVHVCVCVCVCVCNVPFCKHHHLGHQYQLVFHVGGGQVHGHLTIQREREREREREINGATKQCVYIDCTHNMAGLCDCV